MATTRLESEAIWGDEEILTDSIVALTADELNQRVRLIDNEIRVMQSQLSRLQHELTNMNSRIKDNTEKIKLNKQLPYLVANVIEVRKAL